MFGGLFRKLKSGLSLSLVSGAVFGVAGLAVTIVMAPIRGVSLTLEDVLLIPGWFAVGGFLIGATYSIAISVGVRDGTLGRLKSSVLGFFTGPALAAAFFVSESLPFDGRFIRASLILGGIASGVSYLLAAVARDAGESDGESVTATRDSLMSPDPLDRAPLHDAFAEKVRTE